MCEQCEEMETYNNWCLSVKTEAFDRAMRVSNGKDLSDIIRDAEKIERFFIADFSTSPVLTVVK